MHLIKDLYRAKALKDPNIRQLVDELVDLIDCAVEGRVLSYVAIKVYITDEQQIAEDSTIVVSPDSLSATLGIVSSVQTELTDMLMNGQDDPH